MPRRRFIYCLLLHQLRQDHIRRRSGENAEQGISFPHVQDNDDPHSQKLCQAVREQISRKLSLQFPFSYPPRFQNPVLPALCATRQNIPRSYANSHVKKVNSV